MHRLPKLIATLPLTMAMGSALAEESTFTGSNTVAVKAPDAPAVSAKSVQQESAKKTEEPLVLDMLTIKSQKANIDQPFGSYLDHSQIALARTATSDTAQMLKGTPGMSFSGGGGISSRPIIHGMADDRLRTQVDGMNLISACANHMNPALSYVCPFQRNERPGACRNHAGQHGRRQHRRHYPR